MYHCYFWNISSTSRVFNLQQIKLVELFLKIKLITTTQRGQRNEVEMKDQVTSGKSIQRIIKKWYKTGSIRDEHQGRSGRKVTAEMPKKIHDTLSRIKESPRKFSHGLAQEIGVSRLLGL